MVLGDRKAASGRFLHGGRLQIRVQPASHGARLAGLLTLGVANPEPGTLLITLWSKILHNFII